MVFGNGKSAAHLMSDCARNRKPAGPQRIVQELESVWKLYSGGHLPAFSALPVLTDPNVRYAPVLENTVI
jgi:hypothetical protein